MPRPTRTPSATGGGPPSQRAGVPPFRLHDLRHFFASGLIAAGCDVVTVQRALGHAKASTTLETYSHLWHLVADRTRRAAATLVDEVLGNSADYLRTESPKAAYLQVYTLKRNSTTSPSAMT